jgi:hypothetical protein
MKKRTLVKMLCTTAALLMLSCSGGGEGEEDASDAADALEEADGADAADGDAEDAAEEDAGLDGEVEDMASDDVAPEEVEEREWIYIRTEDPVPFGRGVHLMAYDPDRRRVVMVGGQPPGPVPIGDIWEWDGESWTELEPASTELPPRKNHGLAYDESRDLLVVFGGIYGGLAVDPVYLGDTWEWDGSDWTERTNLETDPAPRSGHGMAYDASRQCVVMFGGAGEVSSYNDTWKWDGEQWFEVPIDRFDRPTARFNTRLVYDDGRGLIIMFGGQTEMGGALNDIWEFDGAAWTRLTPEGEDVPAGRGFFGLTFDSGRGVVVLYGGTTTWPPFIEPSNMFADHWEWNGASWNLVLDGEGGPGLLSGLALAYDASRERVVLFGGSNNGTTLLDTTYEY